MTRGLPSPEPEGGGAVELNAPVPRSASAAGATNLPDSSQSAIDGVQAGRDEMVAEVARALGHAGVSPFEIEDWRIADFADRLRRAGFRRVVEDDGTIRIVADSLAGSDGWKILWPGPGEEFEDQLLRYLRAARAVVRALREETA